MITSTMTVRDLIDTVTVNRKAHVAEFTDAMKGSNSAAATWFAEQADKALAGIEFETRFDKPKPQSYEKDYDRVIGMLSRTMSVEITLDEGDFAKYVLDEWEWTERFKLSNSFYVR